MNVSALHVKTELNVSTAWDYTRVSVCPDGMEWIVKTVSWKPQSNIRQKVWNIIYDGPIQEIDQLQSVYFCLWLTNCIDTVKQGIGWRILNIKYFN